MSQNMPLNIFKIIAYVFLSIVLFVGIIVALALSPLGVSALVSMANDQEGVKIEGHSGSFYSSLKFSSIEIEQAALDASLRELSLDIGLNCLFVGEACLQSFSAEGVSLVLKPTEDETPSAPLTDYISLPSPVTIDKFTLQRFDLYQAQAQNDVSVNTDQAAPQKLLSLKDFELALKAQKIIDIRKLTIGELDIYQDEKTAVAVKQVPPETKSVADYLSEVLAFEYEPISIPSVFVPIQLKTNNITLNKLCLVTSQTHCTLKTQLKLSVLNQQIKATLSSQPLEQIVQSFDVSAQVDLSKQYSHQLNLTVRPNAALTSTSASGLTLNANGNSKKTQWLISKSTSSSTTANSSPNNALLDAKFALDLADKELPIDTRLSVNGLAKALNLWLPDAHLPENSLSLSVLGNTENYRLQVSAAINSVQSSQVDIDANVSLKDKVVVLERVASEGAIGELFASGNLALGEGTLSNSKAAHKLTSELNLRFNDLKVQALTLSDEANSNFTSDLSGKLSFNALYLLAQTSTTTNQSGQGADLSTELSGTLLCENIQGTLQAYDIALNCDTRISKNGLIDIRTLSLVQGKRNTLKGKGKIALPSGLDFQADALSLNSANVDTFDLAKISSDFSLQLDLKDLSLLYPDLSGRVGGTVDISGPLDEPELLADVQIEDIVFNTLAITNAQLDLSTNIAKNWQTSLSIELNKLRAEQQSVEQVKLVLEGDIATHTLSLQARNEQYSVDHRLRGKLQLKAQDSSLTEDWQWQGEWLEGDWRLPFASISLQEAFNIRVSPQQSLVSAHCWQVSDTSNDSICLQDVVYKDQSLSTQAKLSLNLTAPLQHYFAEIIMPGTSLPVSSDISLSYSPKAGLNADAYTTITNANVVTSRHKISLMTIVANIEVENDVVNTNVFAGTQSFGSLGLRSELLLAPESRQHNGQLRINNMQLSPLQRFLPTVDKIAGNVNGSINFTGPLDLPMLNGEMNVNDGELVVDNYPYPITNFNQSITLEDNQAKVEGGFELGAGSGEYQADIDFADGFSIVGTLKGAGMQLAYAEHELLATPDLSFDVKPDNIQLTGQITIPNAQFTLKKLPESARSPSSDALIIGQEPPPPIVPIGLDINLRLLLDQPKLKRVNIEALDLKASLSGDLQLKVSQKKNPVNGEFSPLQTYLNGTINVLQGSYEAYGQMLQIRRGEIYFSGPPSLPQFDVTAIRNPLNTADQVIAGVRLSGNPVVPKVELFSEPAMIQARQLSYLLQGTDLDGGAGTSTNVMLVNQLVNYGIGSSENRVNKLGKSFGFDSLNIQTAGQGTNTQVQISGRIAKDIQVTYGVGLFDSASEVILKYQLLPQLYLEAKSGADSALDLFYELSRGE